MSMASNVRIEHRKVDPQSGVGRKENARVWINGVEVDGVTDYTVDTGLEHGVIYQKFTVEMWAKVTIEHVEGEA